MVIVYITVIYTAVHNICDAFNASTLFDFHNTFRREMFYLKLF